MRISKRTDRSGQSYYSFDYNDPITGKRIRLKKSEAPYIVDKAEAEEWAKSQDAHYEALKQANIRRTEWKSKYYDFKDLAARYIDWQKEQAPNSWDRAVVYLERYVLYYFLEIKKSPNANVWYLYFNEFLDWLRVEAKTVRSDRTLALSSQNHVIMTLNTFLDFLARYNLIDPTSKVKCPVHEAHKLGSRGFKDVLYEDEIDLIYPKLKELDPLVADFWWVLLHTGMRFNELYSLPISALFRGHTKGALHEELVEKKLTYYGYLLLDSQCEADSRPRNADKSLKRKPLKGRKTIGPANSRTIPILDKECWNILARLYKEQSGAVSKQTLGASIDNYLLFANLPYNKARLTLRDAFAKLGLPHYKCFHCLRHTYSTKIVGGTRSFFLARTILGHKSESMFDKYCHIFEQIQIESQKQTQVIDEIA